MNEEKLIDVFITTYNSEAHLQDCLEAVRRALPVRRIVIVDHHSTDSTQKIARENDCEIILEEIGLGYARELSFKLARTEVFATIESDLVYHEYGWYERALNLLQGRVAAVVIFIPRSVSEPRGKYNAFWSKYTPLKGKEHGFSAGSTLFRREAVSGLKIPRWLMVEDLYILETLRKSGWGYRWIEAKGIHYSDIESSRKASWFGANARLLYSLDAKNLTQLRRNLTLPAKAAVAAFATLDLSVLAWSLGVSISFLRGWNNPKKYSFLTREKDGIRPPLSR